MQVRMQVRKVTLHNVTEKNVNGNLLFAFIASCWLPTYLPYLTLVFSAPSRSINIHATPRPPSANAPMHQPLPFLQYHILVKEGKLLSTVRTKSSSRGSSYDVVVYFLNGENLSSNQNRDWKNKFLFANQNPFFLNFQHQSRYSCTVDLISKTAEAGE
jgi:hypothetical protein